MSHARLVVLTAVAALGLLASGCTGEDPVNVEAAADTSAAPVTEPAPADQNDDDNEADANQSAENNDHEVGSAHTNDDDEDQDEDSGRAEDDSDAVPPEGVDLVVPISMVEFGYEFDPITIPVGSTVRFDFVNDGAIEHEAMFGDRHQQDEFAATEGDHGSHGAGDDEAGHHGDVMALTLGAGESGSLVVTFDEPGEMEIGCHIAGHWDAGMVAAINIV